MKIDKDSVFACPEHDPENAEKLIAQQDKGSEKAKDNKSE